jgi:hypothetical protein
MSRMIIAGARPYDGAYEIDFDREFSAREWGWIKRFAGYLPVDVDDRTFGDPELACVLAVIAMHRAGRIQPAEAPAAFEKLEDAPFGSAITIETEPEPESREEPDDRPPPPSSSGNGVTSGAGLPTSSATPPSPPNVIGIRGSDISASAPLTSAT